MHISSTWGSVPNGISTWKERGKEYLELQLVVGYCPRLRGHRTDIEKAFNIC